jgi:hypothetical protein
MRGYAIVIAVGALFAFPASALCQAIEVGPGGIRIEQDQGRSASEPDCAELRRACLNKEELGEEGEHNCRRYRELCREE